MRERLTVSPRTFAIVAQTAMAFLVLIVFSGAAVRTTGSGLGCPDWPDCRGTFLPAFEKHTWMEYSNRLLSSVVGVICIAVGVLAFRRRPFRRDLVVPGVVLALGVCGEGAIGAAAVAFHLHWPVVIAHYLLSLVLLAAATTIVGRLREEPAAAAAARPLEAADRRVGAPAGADRPVALATRALVVYGALIIVLGTLATAAGPHAGGAGTGDVVERLRVFGAGTLVTLIKIHGHLAAAMGVGAVVLWLVARHRRAGTALRRGLTGLCLLLALQGALGLWQYHTQLPAEIVWVHSSLPAVMWALLVWCWLAAGELRSPDSRRGAEDAGSDVVVPADAAAPVPSR
jgi:cytochrome c oxidase assembly protein subunit 15